MGTILWIVAYMAPSIIAWYRRRQGKPIVLPFHSLVLANFFLGWTIVGWFLVLANALGYNPVAAIVPQLVKYLPSSGPGAVPPQGSPSSAGPGACGMCGGTGSMMCSSCGGRGSWYDPPSGESGTAQLRTCSACISSGRIRCTSCGGSGRAQALL